MILLLVVFSSVICLYNDYVKISEKENNDVVRTLSGSLHISKINHRWTRNTHHPSIESPDNLAKSSVVEKGEGAQEGVHPGT